jgi:eukaryotic-like serine/threonine-protein kinase
MRCLRLLLPALFAAAVGIGGVVAPASPAAAASQGGASWTQFHYAPTHAGYNPLEKTIGAGNVAKLSLRWQSKLGQTTYGTPVVSGDRVYALSYYGNLYALRRSDGHRLWTAHVGTWSDSTPALWGSLVIVPGRDATGGFMAAYNATSGKLAWRTRVSGTGYISPASVYGDYVYFATATTVYALAASGGKTRWKATLSTAQYGPIDGPIAVSGGGQYVVVATNDGHVYELVGTTGRLAWDVLAGGGIDHGGPAIYSGIIYVPEGRGGSEGGGFDIVALQVSDGHLLWRGYAGDDVHVTPAAGQGRVFIGSIDEGLLALDYWTGALLWTTPYEGEVWGSPVLANGVLYAGTDGGLVAHNAATGVPLFSSQFSQSFANMSSPAVVDGRVYTGSGDGAVMVFGLP